MSLDKSSQANIGILYSQELYDTFPDPLSLLDVRFQLKVLGDLIQDLRRKILNLGGTVILIDEKDISNRDLILETTTTYVFPLLGYVENDQKIIKALESLDQKKHLFNSFYALKNSADKITTSHIFRSNSIPAPETLVTFNTEEAISFIKKYKKILIKPQIGSESMGIAFLHWNEEEGNVVMISTDGRKQTVVFDSTKPNRNPHFSFVETNTEGVTLNPPFLLQEYIKGHDTNHSVLKIYVIDGKATSGLKITRMNTKTERESIISYNDISAGALQEIVLPVNLPVEASDLACRATKAFDLRSGLVDLVWSAQEEKWKVLEVNNDDLGKVRDRSERMDPNYEENGPFDWNYQLAKALIETAQKDKL